ncbi:hypothetical protein [Halococcus salifodinae]|uniref:Uncharacterized protein n=1 Tax=Halococcus salifodinae DSM 8989 TaxID=1227456 RepID=M0N110_9EURY|nr:hypothetical protein [Halococcus salifodinae]EMA50794.1 hypothetical protein C450_13997 [Halococcus salifodinae DSM 8989]
MSRYRPGSRATRRRYLALAAAIGGSLAGCLGGDGGGDSEETATADTEGSDSTAADGTTTDAATTAETSPTAGAGASTTVATDSATPGTTTGNQLDLREANVVGVEVESTADGYRFDVTLYHDDDGEDGYANWWQVENLGGERLGRRELRHPHGTTRFTRSESIEVPDGTERVVVRGHDQTHGYGGQAMLVTLETGATEIVGQGPETQSFDGNGSGSVTTTGGG